MDLVNEDFGDVRVDTKFVNIFKAFLDRRDLLKEGRLRTDAAYIPLSAYMYGWIMSSLIMSHIH